jgi:hypothetical protein
MLVESVTCFKCLIHPINSFHAVSKSVMSTNSNKYKW